MLFIREDGFSNFFQIVPNAKDFAGVIVFARPPTEQPKSVLIKMFEAEKIAEAKMQITSTIYSAAFHKIYNLDAA